MHKFKIFIISLSIIALSGISAILTMAPAAAADPIWSDTLANRVAPDNTYIYDSANVSGLVFEVGESNGEGVVYIYDNTTSNWSNFNVGIDSDTEAVTSIENVGGLGIIVGTKNENGAEIAYSLGAPFLPLGGWEQDPDITEIFDIAFDPVREIFCASVNKLGNLAIYCTTGEESAWEEFPTYQNLTRDIPSSDLERLNIGFAYDTLFVIGYDANTGHSALFQHSLNPEDSWTDVSSDTYGTEFVVTSFVVWQGAPVISVIDTTGGFNFLTIAGLGDGWGQLGENNLGQEVTYRRPPRILTDGFGLYVSALTQSNFSYFALFDTEENSWDIINSGGLEPENTQQFVSALTTVSGGTTYVAATNLGEGFQDFGVYTNGEFEAPADLDGDGVENNVEDSIGNGDNNDDGTPDSEQSNVTSVENPANDGWIAIQVDSIEGCTQLSNVTAKEEGELDNQDSSYSYPSGVIGYVLQCDDPGDSASISVFYSNVVEEDSLRKVFDDGSSSIIDGATVGVVVYGDESEHSSINYTIVDGEDLDIDGQADATIVDPVGLAAVQAVASTTTTTIVVPPVNAASGSLPTTGLNTNIVIIFAIGLLASGAVLIRKRRLRLQ